VIHNTLPAAAISISPIVVPSPSISVSETSNAEKKSQIGAIEFDDPFANTAAVKNKNPSRNVEMAQTPTADPASEQITLPSHSQERISNDTSMSDFIASIGEGLRVAEGFEGSFAQNYSSFTFPVSGFRGIMYVDGSWRCGLFSTVHSRQYKKYNCDTK
jgi:hypothetical protein